MNGDGLTDILLITTSIIGYADMLCSHQLNGEQKFASANYIYTEGKRLEAMSLRLLDIIVTKRSRIRFQTAAADSFLISFTICKL